MSEAELRALFHAKVNLTPLSPVFHVPAEGDKEALDVASEVAVRGWAKWFGRQGSHHLYELTPAGAARVGHTIVNFGD